jgi:hypothetical protein
MCGFPKRFGAMEVNDPTRPVVSTVSIDHDPEDAWDYGLSWPP